MDVLNRAVFDVLYGISDVAFIRGVIIFCAVILPYFLVARYVWFLKTIVGDWRLRVLFAAETVLAIILSYGVLVQSINFFYHAARPFVTLEIEPLISKITLFDSFPSAHATIFFTLATTLVLWNKKWGGIFYGLAFLNGLARVASGVHWPIDIASGAVLGIVSALCVHMLIAPVKEQFSKPKEEL